MRSTIRSFTTMLIEHAATRRAVFFAFAACLASVLWSAPLRARPMPEDDAAPPVRFDCNQNGIDDAVDIAVGSSGDVNGNGVPDECEALATAASASSASEDAALLTGACSESSAIDGGAPANPDASTRCESVHAVHGDDALPSCTRALSRRTEFAERRVQHLRRARGDRAPCRTFARPRRRPARRAAPTAPPRAGLKTLG